MNCVVSTVANSCIQIGPEFAQCFFLIESMKIPALIRQVWEIAAHMSCTSGQMIQASIHIFQVDGSTNRLAV